MKGNGWLQPCIITATPNGSGSISAGSWMAQYYQQNQTQKNPNFDTSGKLVIQNYAKNLWSGVFWGWDIISADEAETEYIFGLRSREGGILHIHITLSRELQYSPMPYYSDKRYKCCIENKDEKWDEVVWLTSKDINHKTFWGTIETIVDKHHPLLPF